MHNHIHSQIRLITTFVFNRPEKIFVSNVLLCIFSTSVVVWALALLHLWGDPIIFRNKFNLNLSKMNFIMSELILQGCSFVKKTAVSLIGPLFLCFPVHLKYS